jgi:hypothetical protein
MTTTTSKKMGRLRLVLIAAAALGSSSTVLSGTIAALGAQTELSRPVTLA